MLIIVRKSFSSSATGPEITHPRTQDSLRLIIRPTKARFVLFTGIPRRSYRVHRL